MKPVILLMLIIILASCTQFGKITYKFSDKPAKIECNTATDALLNEALYSFEEDILTKYDSTNKRSSAAYARFIYNGISGTEDYKSIANPHSLQIKDALLAKGILSNSGGKSNLNYQHPDVACIIDNIEDPDLKRTIQALISIDGMDPALFNDRLRNAGSTMANSPNKAAYVALDAYYQNLVNLE